MSLRTLLERSIVASRWRTCRAIRAGPFSSAEAGLNNPELQPTHRVRLMSLR